MSPIQVKKVLDEGSSSPFITRLMFGVLNLRDNFYLLNANGPEKQRKKSEFDSAYKPSWTQLRRFGMQPGMDCG